MAEADPSKAEQGYVVIDGNVVLLDLGNILLRALREKWLDHYPRHNMRNGRDRLRLK